MAARPPSGRGSRPDAATTSAARAARDPAGGQVRALAPGRDGGEDRAHAVPRPDLGPTALVAPTAMWHRRGLPIRRRKWKMLSSMRGWVRGVAAAACLAGSATAALIASAPASAGDGGACAGSLIDTRNAIWDGKKIGELDVYYDAATGRNCAKMNHAGATWGKRVWTGVQITVCEEGRPGNGCHSVAGGDAQDIG